MALLLIDRAAEHGQRLAIVDTRGEHSYRDLLSASSNSASLLLEHTRDLAEARVAFMVAPGFDYAAVQWGIWRAGGIAVPLSLSHPAPELEYVLRDTAASAVIADAQHEARLRPLVDTCGIPLHKVGDTAVARALPDVAPNRRGMILYTSGTTSRPKGVVTTHDNLRAQIEALVTAWEWQPSDRVLHVLPLHHTHGIVNVLLCALWSGAVCEMMPRFDAALVWDRFLQGGLTLFMAVPTIYVKLIAAFDQAPVEEQTGMRAAGRQFRLLVSGSAALPVTTFERWREISGHELLERYGMTEIGMALSNPLHGERRPGTVGQPLPTVEVRLVGENEQPIGHAETAGEIHVRGPSVFKEYWNLPDATRDAFVDSWFRTGDVAVVENGYYRILGRSSVDIIKTGGYKVSALEIEEVLRSHPAVRDCAVVGIEDVEWGERVCAAVVTDRAEDAELRDWLSERLASYKLPRLWLRVRELPRNAMGKVTKPEVKRLFA